MKNLSLPFGSGQENWKETTGLLMNAWLLEAKEKHRVPTAHHAKMDLNKKSSPKKKNLQTFKVDAKGFRKNRNENFPT